MKLSVAIVVILILAGIGSAETYQLGSHNVSLNLSIPANYSMDLPILGETRHYYLNITPDTGGFALVTVQELSIPIYSSEPTRKFADNAIEGIKSKKIGDTKYGMTTYRGLDAFEMSYPAQRVLYEGSGNVAYPEYHCLAYQLDELTVVTIQTNGTNEALFEELKGSVEVTGHKSFLGLTSAYAEAENGTNTGIENQNATVIPGNFQSSNISDLEDMMYTVAMQSQEVGAAKVSIDDAHIGVTITPGPYATDMRRAAVDIMLDGYYSVLLSMPNYNGYLRIGVVENKKITSIWEMGADEMRRAHETGGSNEVTNMTFDRVYNGIKPISYYQSDDYGDVTKSVGGPSGRLSASEGNWLGD